MSMSVEQVHRVISAAVELIAVAKLRGDNELPHPADDEKHWTARMQDAWSEIESAVEDAQPGEIEVEYWCGRKQEKV